RERVAAGRLLAFLRALAADHAAFGLPERPETFPKSASIRHTTAKCGSWLRLPGKHHTRDEWSRVWDGKRWLAGTAAIDFILARGGAPPDLRAGPPPAAPRRGRTGTRPGP